jgi:hypothetical protein
MFKYFSIYFNYKCYYVTKLERGIYFMYLSFYFETFAEFPICRGMKYAVLLIGQTEMHLYYVIAS